MVLLPSSQTALRIGYQELLWGLENVSVKLLGSALQARYMPSLRARRWPSGIAVREERSVFSEALDLLVTGDYLRVDSVLRNVHGYH